MKRADLLRRYEARTATLSTIVRQLSFAGIAIVWIFKTDDGGRAVVPAALVTPAMLLVFTLMLDLLQYAYASILFGSLNRWHERKRTPEEQDVNFRPRWNWPTLGLFWGKTLTLAVGYLFLLGYLLDTLVDA